MMACTLGVWAAVRPSSAQQAAMLSTATTTVRHTGLRQTTQAGLMLQHLPAGGHMLARLGLLGLLGLPPPDDELLLCPA